MLHCSCLLPTVQHTHTHTHTHQQGPTNICSHITTEPLKAECSIYIYITPCRYEVFHRSRFLLEQETNKPTVGPTTRPGIRQEQWCHLWRSGFRYYVHTWPLGNSWGSDRHDRADHCLSLKRRTSITNNSNESCGSFRRSVARLDIVL
jgi:hypothetical protein